MPGKKIELFRSEFNLEKPSHIPFNNGGMSLMTKKCAAVMNEVTAHMSTEGTFHEPFFKRGLEAKKILAKFLDADLEEVAWTPNCSSSISYIANGYEHKSGEEIVIFENEYPANYYPWVDRAKRLGSKIEIVPAGADLVRDTDVAIKKINSNTRIVAVSHIQSDSGNMADLSRLSEAAKSVGALFLVDVIQSMGVTPLSLKTSGADVICGGSHKWVCGVQGGGVLAVKKEHLSKIRPSLHGALNYGTFEDGSCLDRKCFEDARKFEQGTPSFHAILGSAASLEVLSEYGVDNLRKKILELRSFCEEHMKEMGFRIFGTHQRTGPHLSAIHPKKSLSEISNALNEDRITYSLRPAPVEGGKVLRLSPHAYNTEEEAELVMKSLKKVLI